MSPYIENAFKIRGRGMYLDYVTPGLETPLFKKHRELSDDVRVVGYTDRKGCFAVRQLGESHLRVVYFPNLHPRDVSESALSNAPHHNTFENQDGWGFAALAVLRSLGVVVWERKSLFDFNDPKSYEGYF